MVVLEEAAVEVEAEVVVAVPEVVLATVEVSELEVV